MSYGDTSKVHRRLFHRFLNTNEVKRLEKFQYLSVHEFLHRLVENPKGFFGHVKLYGVAFSRDHEPGTHHVVA